MLSILLYSKQSVVFVCTVWYLAETMACICIMQLAKAVISIRTLQQMLIVWQSVGIITVRYVRYLLSYWLLGVLNCHGTRSVETSMHAHRHSSCFTLREREHFYIINTPLVGLFEIYVCLSLPIYWIGKDRIFQS